MQPISQMEDGEQKAFVTCNRPLGFLYIHVPFIFLNQKFKTVENSNTQRKFFLIFKTIYSKSKERQYVNFLKRKK